MFVSLRIFYSSPGFFLKNFPIFFILVCFKDDVKITFQVETTFLRGAIDFRKDVGIYILKYVLVAGQVVP